MKENKVPARSATLKWESTHTLIWENPVVTLKWDVFSNVTLKWDVFSKVTLKWENPFFQSFLHKTF